MEGLPPRAEAVLPPAEGLPPHFEALGAKAGVKKEMLKNVISLHILSYFSNFADGNMKRNMFFNLKTTQPPETGNW